MIWYIFFFITAVPALLLALVDLRRNGLDFKKLKTSALLFIVLATAANLVYTPIDHLDSENVIRALKARSILHEQNYLSLKKENEALLVSNNLLNKRIELLDKGFNKYRKNIMGMSVSIDLQFIANTQEDISSNSIISAPSTIYAIGENYHDRSEPIKFQTQDNSYQYFRVGFVDEKSIFNFKVKSEVMDGKFPIGMPLAAIKKIRSFRVYIPVFKSFYANDPKLRNIHVSRANVVFTINGKTLKKKLLQNNFLSQIGDIHYVGQDSWFYVSFPLKDNLFSELDLLNF